VVITSSVVTKEVEGSEVLFSKQFSNPRDDKEIVAGVATVVAPGGSL